MDEVRGTKSHDARMAALMAWACNLAIDWEEKGFLLLLVSYVDDSVSLVCSPSLTELSAVMDGMAIVDIEALSKRLEDGGHLAVEDGFYRLGPAL